MVVCLVLQALVAAILAWDSWHGSATREHLLVASVLLGMARAFQMPAVQATTPNTVPPQLLSRAMGASSTAAQGSVIAGPTAGGMLLVLGNDVLITFGLSKCFWLSMLVLFVNGAADMVSVVIRQTLVQLETPDEMRGRAPPPV